MNRAGILFSGGYSHPFAESSPALASLAANVGWSIEIEEDVDTALERLSGSCLFMVNALHWSMTQHEKYAPDRHRYAYHLPDSHMDAIETHVSSGGRLFVLHVGTICWDTQPRWREVMGGGWQWGHSHHPPFGEVTVKLTGEGRSLSPGPDQFVLFDEGYHNLDPSADCKVLATCEIDEGPQPVAWVRHYGKGRVAVDALGHDARSVNASGHRELIAAQLAWLAQ